MKFSYLLSSMDTSCKFLKAQLPLDNDTFSTEFFHGRSKAQISLTKILLTISSFPPTETSNQNEELVSGERNTGKRALFCEDRGFDIDLNIRLGPPEVEEILQPSAADVVAENGGELCEIGVVDKTDFPKAKEESYSEGEESGIVEEREFVQSSGIGCNGHSEETVMAEQRQSEKQEEVNGDGGLDLLIEAAELISGNFKNGQSEPDRPSRDEELPETEPANNEATAERGDFWTVEELYGNFEDLSPVVRSKRGRNQVLPYKYRDSFLEPLKPVTRQRSAAVSSKRRSRRRLLKLCDKVTAPETEQGPRRESPKSKEFSAEPPKKATSRSGSGTTFFPIVQPSSPPVQSPTPLSIQSPQAEPLSSPLSQTAPTEVGGAGDEQAPPSLWPAVSSDFPFYLFDNFVLPEDDERFEDNTARELADFNVKYLSKASAVTVRLLRRLVETEQRDKERDAEVAWQEARRQSASASWLKEKAEHAKIALRCKELFDKVERLEQEAVEGERSRKMLQESWIQSQKECADLKKERFELMADNQGLVRKLESVETKLLMSKEARVVVEQSFASYKATTPLLTEDLKEQIRQEYRTSDELEEEVLRNFDLGYRVARAKDKSKMSALQQDPTVLDSSDEDIDG